MYVCLNCLYVYVAVTFSGFSTKTPVAGFFSTVQTSTPAGSTNNEGGRKASDNTENDDADDEASKVERKT